MRELMVVAGEASGDAHAAELILELQRRNPGLRAFGCGGDRMAAAGCELLVSAHELGVVGLAEVVGHIPRLYRLWRRLKNAMRARRPDTLILVDFPDFNLRLAAAAARDGIPVIYFVSPQLWAWRSGRVRQIRRRVRRMICIFPFEEEFYRAHGVAVAAVGHPLVERIAAARRRMPSEEEFRQAQGIGAGELIALLPGSRRRELEFHLPTLFAAVERLAVRPGRTFVLPVAPGLEEEGIAGALPEGLRGRVHLVGPEHAYAAVAYARLALVASGTATVETALLGTPMVVFYRLSDWTYRLGRRLVHTPHFAMVNLIAGRQVVPELIQRDFTAEGLAAWAERLLPEGEDRRGILEALDEVQARLGPPGAIVRAADAVEAALRAEPEHPPATSNE